MQHEHSIRQLTWIVRLGSIETQYYYILRYQNYEKGIERSMQEMSQPRAWCVLWFQRLTKQKQRKWILLFTKLIRHYVVTRSTFTFVHPKDSLPKPTQTIHLNLLSHDTSHIDSKESRVLLLLLWGCVDRKELQRKNSSIIYYTHYLFIDYEQIFIFLHHIKKTFRVFICEYKCTVEITRRLKSQQLI